MGGVVSRRWGTVAVAVAVVGFLIMSSQLLVDRGKDSDLMQWLKDTSDRLGYWAIPAYVGIHTLTLAFCLPCAIFFEAGASILFGFLPALFCVFFAKVLGASLSFWIGRFVFKSSGSAAQWVQQNKYFHLLSKGVEQDGWRFVLLARFSPVPSYVINYALAATKVGFLVDFLLPTVIGCLPMILQNTSIGSLASAAVASASGSQRSQLWSYIFPLLGILSSILISLRIKKYSSAFAISHHPPAEISYDTSDAVKASYHEPSGGAAIGRNQGLGILFGPTSAFPAYYKIWPAQRLHTHRHGSPCTKQQMVPWTSQFSRVRPLLPSHLRSISLSIISWAG